MNLGESIKRIRKEKGITQKQLGEKLGISQAAIGQFESNKANPKIETIQKIADALNVTVNEIIPNSDDKYMKIGLEYSATDYGLIEAMATHKIFSNRGKKKIFQKIETYRTALSKMNDVNRQLDYSQKTHDDLEDSLLKILLTKPNYSMSDVIIVLSCFLSLKSTEQSAIVEILLEHCYSDINLKYSEPPKA